MEERTQRSWATTRRCTECGATDWPPNGRRAQCSGRCQGNAHRRRTGENICNELVCQDCGETFDISAKPGERKQRSDAKRCPECRGRKTFKMARSGTGSSIGRLRQLGDACGICGGAVDFSLRAPNGLAPSVDHIIPVDSNGSDDASNLQLAHLWCNQRKNTGVVERAPRNFYWTQRWRKFARLVREENPQCQRCGAPTFCASHVVPIAAGGDPWDRANVQALCRDYRNTKAVHDYHDRCRAAAG